MIITWLGHSGFRIEIGDQVLLVDPWMTGNPVFPEGARDTAISGATHILVSHGHGDHSADALAISRETGAPTIYYVNGNPGVLELQHPAHTHDNPPIPG